MNRFVQVMLVIALAMITNPGLAMSQTDSELAPEEMILRMEENEAWFFHLNDDGTPAQWELSQMRGGEPQMELQPSTAENYALHQVQDVYVSYAAFLPNSDYYYPFTTELQIRVISFPDDAAASGYLESVYDMQVQAIELGEAKDSNLAPIDPLPESEYPLVGWTRYQEYSSFETGESLGFGSSVRYHAQVGNHLVSAEATGPFVDYNFDLAYWLLHDQARCVQMSSPCLPVSMPMGSGEYMFIGGVYYLLDGAGEARWIFPVESPVRAPQESVTLTTESAGDQPEEDSEQSTTSPDSFVGTATVIAASANVRSEPSANATIVAIATAGEIVEITGDSVEADGFEWVPIITASGVEGWIATTLIQRNE